MKKINLKLLTYQRVFETTTSNKICEGSRHVHINIAKKTDGNWLPSFYDILGRRRSLKQHSQKKQRIENWDIWVFPKIVVPPIIHFNRDFHYKPSILGYHYFWKHPFLPGSSKCVKFVPFSPEQTYKKAENLHLEDPGNIVNPVTIETWKYTYRSGNLEASIGVNASLGKIWWLIQPPWNKKGWILGKFIN